MDQENDEAIPTEEDATGSPKRKSIQSVEVGIRLLNALAEASSSLRLREIAALSGLSRSQAHRYLLSYVNTGMVRQETETGQYELGPLAIKVGLAALRRSEPVSVGGDALVQLVEHTGLSGQLITWGQFGPTIVRFKTGRRHVPIALQVGSVVSPFSSSAGRVFLAYLPESIANEAARNDWRQTHPDNPNGWKSELKKNQFTVREAGFAAVDGSTIPGLSAISAPILDCDGQIVLTLTLVARETEKITEKQEIISMLCEKAREASQRLGYSPSTEYD